MFLTLLIYQDSKAQIVSLHKIATFLTLLIYQDSKADIFTPLSHLKNLPQHKIAVDVVLVTISEIV